MNKKGGEKYLSVWWFFVLVIIAVGIVVGVSMFNVADISTKEIESDILVSRIADCIIDNGYINGEFLSGNFDVFDECYLNKEIIDKEEGNYYLGLEVYDFDNCEVNEGEFECKNPKEKPEPLSFGVAAFKTQCGIQEEQRYYPSCSEEYIYVLNKQGEKLLLHISAGSKQVVKREV